MSPTIQMFMDQLGFNLVRTLKTQSNIVLVKNPMVLIFKPMLQKHLINFLTNIVTNVGMKKIKSNSK